MFQNLLNNVRSLVTPQTRYTINNYQVLEEKLLSEGGYAYVYRVCDAQNPKQKYALKKMMIGDTATLKAARTEVDIWQKLGSHPNIVKFISAQQVKQEDGKTSMLILCELCEGGTLVDTISRHNNSVPEDQAVQIFRDIVKGVKHMHSKGIAHRDLKVENILYHNGKYKLADFGSASTETMDYSTSSKLEISKAIERYEKYTTLMYRPPEMIDQYLQYTVNLQADIWMLGCVLYTLSFAKQPFQDAQNLAIINAHYSMPSEVKISNKMTDLIRIMLTPNPSKRPDILQLEGYVMRFKTLDAIVLSDDALEIKLKQEALMQNKSKKGSLSKQGGVKAADWTPFDKDHHSAEEETSWDNYKFDQQTPKWQNPFDKDHFAPIEEVKAEKEAKSTNPFDEFGFDDQDDKAQTTWFSTTNEAPKYSKDQEEEDTPQWAQWENQSAADPHSNQMDPLDEEDQLDEEEGKPNMFDQINTLKSQSRGKKIKRPKHTAKSWCSNMNQGIAVESSRVNICTRTSDLISKLREFMQKS